MGQAVVTDLPLAEAHDLRHPRKAAERHGLQEPVPVDLERGPDFLRIRPFLAGPVRSGRLFPPRGGTRGSCAATGVPSVGAHRNPLASPARIVSLPEQPDLMTEEVFSLASIDQLGDTTTRSCPI